VAKNRIRTWFVALIVLGVGVLLAAIAGLWGYMTATDRPLHPDPKVVVAVTSNITFADIEPLALRIAQAFAEKGKSSTHK
jgi:hypothetical protein